ncbi:hypothetical protein BDB00DRAFT_748524, partial [Zychaea mexicana]|uniref:uncharacterized protein n=1 Tax=Zychaea mexicana TaxID=64656 RepID=UPI0022FEE6B2
YHERSRLLRWRLGWMPNGRPDAHCRNCSNSQHLSRHHVIACLQAHQRSNIPYGVPDPISYVLDTLPTKRPYQANKRRHWQWLWPRLTTLLADIDRLCHD